MAGSGDVLRLSGISCICTSREPFSAVPCCPPPFPYFQLTGGHLQGSTTVARCRGAPGLGAAPAHGGLLGEQPGAAQAGRSCCRATAPHQPAPEAQDTSKAQSLRRDAVHCSIVAAARLRPRHGVPAVSAPAVAAVPAVCNAAQCCPALPCPTNLSVAGIEASERMGAC